MRYIVIVLSLALFACGPARFVDDNDYFAPYLEVELFNGATLFPGERFAVYAEDFDSDINRLRVALDGSLLVDYRYNRFARVEEFIRVPYAPGWRVIYVEVLDSNFNRASRTYEVYIAP